MSDDLLTADDGVEIAVWQGPTESAQPVMLLHGLGSTARATWEATGWFRALAAAGCSWLAPDLRGHGDSGRPHDPQSYGLTQLVRDVVLVLDHAAVSRVDLIGYSLGSRVALEFAATWPDRVGRLVLGGFGDGSGSVPVQELLDRLPASVDREAVAACAHGAGAAAPVRTADMRAPALLVAGDGDRFAGSIESLASQLLDARSERVSGRNHFNVLSAAAFKQAALAFLQTRP